MAKKILRGKVVSDKMNKTLIVLVEKIKEHQIYRKKYRISKKYKVHNEKNEYKIGDEVKIIQTSPKSKEKRWTIVSKNKNERRKK